MQFLLLPLTPIYKALNALDRSLKSRKKVFSTLPVISIGNLSMGGSGKTPLLQYLLRSLQDKITPLILTRGYGRTDSRRTTIVSLPAGPIPSADVIGDEPVLHCQSIANGTVVVTTFRAQFLKEHDSDFPGSVVFLDDGFQHYALHRDLDIVIVDDKTAASGRVIPAGALREPPAQLARADVLLCTSANAEKFAKKWGRPDIPLFRIINEQPYITHHFKSDLPLDPAELRSMRFCLVTGIANPGRVAGSAKGCGLTITTHISYNDHHTFSDVDLKTIAKEVHQSGSDAILTTTKDMTRLSAHLQPEDKVFVIHQPVRIQNNHLLLDLIMDTIRKKITVK